jgi:Tfp pilus assembly protein PilO
MKPLANHSSAVRVLSGLTLAVPIALLFSVYLFGVQPKLEAARTKRAEADAVRERLAAAQGALQAGSNLPSTASAVREFEIRTPADDRVSDVLRMLGQLASSSSVGKLEAVVIEAGSPTTAGDGIESISSGTDPRLALFGSAVSGTPIAMSFDASYGQVGRFFWNLRTLPTTVDVRSIDVRSVPGSSLLRVKTDLLAFHRSGGRPSQRPTLTPDVAQTAAPPAVDVTSTPTWPRNLFRPPAVPEAAAAAEVLPDPVVQTILYSPLRSVALVDGKIVRVGDRLNAGSVTAIERDAVTIETPSGGRKRLALKAPAPQGTIR